MSPPQFGHATPVVFNLMYLHSGQALHAVYSPKRPCWIARFLPHTGQSSPSAISCLTVTSPAPFTIFLVLRHSGYPEHAMNSRSEEHTSELQSRVDISYAVFCLKKK